MKLLTAWYALLRFRKANYIAAFLAVVLLGFAVPRGSSPPEGDASYWHGLATRLSNMTVWKQSLVAATGALLLLLTMSFVLLWVGTFWGSGSTLNRHK
jgi:hypothetical protein